MKTKTKIAVSCIQCPNCLDIIYSRANHDFRACTCGQSFVDGGFDYIRFGGVEFDKIKIFKKYINGETRQSLYNDWNNRTNKYGLITNTTLKIKSYKQDIKFYISGRCIFHCWRYLKTYKDTLCFCKRFNLFNIYFSMSGTVKFIYY